MKLRTGMILTAVTGVAGVLVVEGFALANDKGGDTLSEIIASVAALSNAMPFALGALTGHFASRRKINAPTWLRLVLGLSLVPLAALLHFTPISPIIATFSGVIAGWVMWPLKK